MNQASPFNSEEDIRTKIVTEWLVSHGFNLSNISLEFSFEIQLGRNIYQVGPEKPANSVLRPRADILVRSCDGRNLLIVEVKALDEKLDDNVRAQGISYARLLKEGGIAPFVILTNGQETKIFDSISGDLINGTSIPVNHPHVENGFKVSGDDLALRTEALETLISLSPDNLLEFCRSQVFSRMRCLQNDDPYSGYKYIPALYIERKEASEKLNELLEKQRKVVLIIGSPQVGKTNFVCHTVEEKLTQGMPCLFYSAIGMEGGLLEEICLDFQWIINDTSSCHQIVNKLTRILQKVGQKLIIFIDGWNEASQNLARAIDQGSERLSFDSIQIVISLTNLAARHLLLDEAGNPSYVAEAASISINEISQMEITPEKMRKDWSTIYLPKYSLEETEKAYQKYAEVFNVQVPNEHKKVDDPFLLRMGMELFRGKKLIPRLDEPELLSQSIDLKASRAIDLKDYCVHTLLQVLAEEMVAHNAPVPQKIAMERWGLPPVQNPPKGLFEAALLAKVHSEYNLLALDFYYGRERDFIIACWVCKWDTVFLQDYETILAELDAALQTTIKTEALRWFLRQPKYQDRLKYITQFFTSYTDYRLQIIILLSIRESFRSSDLSYEDLDWIMTVIKQGAEESNPLVKAEAAKLMTIFQEDDESLASLLSYNDKELITNFLDIDREDTITGASVIKVIINAFQQVFFESDEYDFDSEFVKLLGELMNHHLLTVKTNAIQTLGAIFPKGFLRLLSEKINSGISFDKTYFIEGLKLAIDTIQDDYYGYFCPGYLDSLRDSPKELWSEYSKMYQICIPVISFYYLEKCSDCLLDILISLYQLIKSQKSLDYLDVVNLKDEILLKQHNQLSIFQNPKQFLDFLANIIMLKQLDDEELKSYEQDIKVAVDSLNFCYFNKHNISQIEQKLSLKELNTLGDEYRELHKICSPIINFYYPKQCSQELLSLLRELLSIIKNLQFKWDIPEEENYPLPSIGDILIQQYQLSLFSKII